MLSRVRFTRIVTIAGTIYTSTIFLYVDVLPLHPVGDLETNPQI